jgi:4-amino-4-deoxy-L-arabinose transferase-like glycosyltransferase
MKNKRDTLARWLWPLACFVISLLVLHPRLTASPIVADGYQNLSIAVNLVQHGVFSSTPESLPDMVREPAWPALTAGLLWLTGHTSTPAEVLASQHALLFKQINLALYALLITAVCSLIHRQLRSLPYAIPGLVLSLIVFYTMPRLFNYYNNEALAALLLFIASLLLFRLQQQPRPGTALAAGLTLGLLALTKAQFLYIPLVPLLILAWRYRRHAAIAAAVFLLVVTPWMVRNALLFDHYTIAERGKTVAAVRLMLTIAPSGSEYRCMAYAFSHPDLRPAAGHALGISAPDFLRHGRCERLNRETCFDMGTERVPCTAFAEDQPPAPWQQRIQYFYQGYAAGEEMEAGRLRFADITPLNGYLVSSYLVTLPLFAWRGMGFSGYPVLSILLTFALFALCLTRYWAFSLLAATASLFHLALTHNIPRYHTAESGVMLVAIVWLVGLIAARLQHRRAPRQV